MDIPAHRRCIWVGPYCARRHAHDVRSGRRCRSFPAPSSAADGVASNPTTRSVAAALIGGRRYTVNAFVTGASSAMDASLRGSAEAVGLTERRCIHHIR